MQDSIVLAFVTVTCRDVGQACIKNSTNTLPILFSSLTHMFLFVEQIPLIIKLTLQRLTDNVQLRQIVYSDLLSIHLSFCMIV